MKQLPCCPTITHNTLWFCTTASVLFLQKYFQS